MKALLLVAHGSRKESSNQEVAQLSSQMQRLVNEKFDFVKHGFLELAEPSIPDAIDNCCQQGATHITVVPYFLSAGRHVTEDIPEEVEIGQKNNPDVEITVSNYLGAQDEIAALLVEAAVYAQGGR